MSNRVKGVAKFSLPYREGMENETWFLDKKESAADGYPGETMFAFFGVPYDMDIGEALTFSGLTQESAIVAGAGVKVQNKSRGNGIGTIGKKYGIKVAGTGGIGKQDEKLIRALASLTNNDYKKVSKAFAASTGKELTQEEFDGIVA